MYLKHNSKVDKAMGEAANKLLSQGMDLLSKHFVITITFNLSYNFSLF